MQTRYFMVISIVIQPQCFKSPGSCILWAELEVDFVVIYHHGLLLNCKTFDGHPSIPLLRFFISSLNSLYSMHSSHSVSLVVSSHPNLLGSSFALFDEQFEDS
jgi:hypothetical protein